MRWIFLCLVCLSLCPWPAFSQVNTGELRLKVTDPTGAGVAASVSIVSHGNQYDRIHCDECPGNRRHSPATLWHLPGYRPEAGFYCRLPHRPG